MPDVTDLRKRFERVREDGLAMVVIGEEKRGTLDRVQAFMAVLEGYAEHVMDAVGATVLDDLPGLRSALSKRRRDRSGLLKLLERLIGMDLKLRQYEQGKAFCDGVVARGGIEGLNRVWSAPEAMPTIAELERPRGLAAPHRAGAAAARLVVEHTFVRTAQSRFTARSRVWRAARATKWGKPL